MAVLFDKELTFKQRLSQYDKESLKVIAEQLGLRRLSKLKKAELIDLVAERFLNPEILFYRAAILCDKEMDLIEKGSGNGPIVFSPEDYDWIGRLNEMDFVAASSNLYMIPCDLAEALEKIRTPEFEAYRKRLIDRFGAIPDVAEELIRVVPLRVYGKQLGIEKIMLKQGQMFLYFVSNPDSPYFQSEAFGKILNYVSNHPRQCNFREANGKRSVVISPVASVGDALTICRTIATD